MTALPQHRVKIIRLQNGEDLISDCIMDDGEEWIQLNDPMTLIVKRSIKGTVMMMVPWLPLEVVSDNMATISFHDVLTFAEPKEDLVEYYNGMVEQAKISVARNDDVLKALKDDLTEYRDETLNEMFPEEEEKIRSYLENSSNDRKKKLH